MANNNEIINFGYNKTDNIPEISYILNMGVHGEKTGEGL